MHFLLFRSFRQYLATGLAAMIGVDAFTHMGVALGILPTTGLVLPFVSYGRSSLVVALMCRVAGERVRTFSIGFESDRASELEHARTGARHLGTDHHEYVVRAMTHQEIRSQEEEIASVPSGEIPPG